MNFKGAVFDLDGTLFSSTHIWEQVDEIFLSKRNLPIPSDYVDSIAHLSVSEAANYTISRFNLDEKPEDITEEWRVLASELYPKHAELKPHALSYLKLLHEKGIKLAVATGMPESIYKPALKRFGILELFTATCSVDDVGTGKGSPDVFLLAAQRLGLPPKDCIAFDDIPTALRSAKEAGLRVFGVYDAHSAHLKGEIEEFADGYICDMSFAPVPE